MKKETNIAKFLCISNSHAPYIQLKIAFVLYFLHYYQAKRAIEKYVGIAVNRHRSEQKSRFVQDSVADPCSRIYVAVIFQGHRWHTHQHTPLSNDSVLVYPNTTRMDRMHACLCCVVLRECVCVFSNRDQPSTTTTTTATAATTAAAAHLSYSIALTACVCFTCCLLACWFVRHGDCNTPTLCIVYVKHVSVFSFLIVLRFCFSSFDAVVSVEWMQQSSHRDSECNCIFSPAWSKIKWDFFALALNFNRSSRFGE